MARRGLSGPDGNAPPRPGRGPAGLRDLGPGLPKRELELEYRIPRLHSPVNSRRFPESFGDLCYVRTSLTSDLLEILPYPELKSSLTPEPGGLRPCSGWPPGFSRISKDSKGSRFLEITKIPKVSGFLLFPRFRKDQASPARGAAPMRCTGASTSAAAGYPTAAPPSPGWGAAPYNNNKHNNNNSNYISLPLSLYIYIYIYICIYVYIYMYYIILYYI